MHININDNGTIQSWGIAVIGNLNVADELLPTDFYDNAFWRYRWNGDTFDVLKAEIAADNTIFSVGFDINGPECPTLDTVLNFPNYTYENGQFVNHEPEANGQ